MLLVGSILPAGAGAQLWQLDGAAPANIELNTSAGAAGIVATIPGNTNYALSLSDSNAVFPLPAAIFYNLDLASFLVAFCGVFFETFLTAGLGFRNVVTQNTAGIRAQATNKIEMFNEENSGTNLSARVTVENFNNVKNELSNNTGLVGGRLVIDTAAATVAYFNPATNLLVNEFLVDSQFNFRDGAGVNLFRVGAAGELQTNQTAASVAVRAKVAEMPIFDQTGALVGYININL